MMNLIAIMGLLYLPGTFVSVRGKSIDRHYMRFTNSLSKGLFSTTFFQNNTGTMVVAPMFWVYWAVTGPVTILTIVFAFVFHNWGKPFGSYGVGKLALDLRRKYATKKRGLETEKGVP
jgi:hypothetical protein